VYYATILPKQKPQMIWTKKHSRNAVAARARRRLERENKEVELSPVGKVYVPRKIKPDFILRIEAKTGERTQLSVIRFGKQFITSDGIKSARQISAGIEHLMRGLHL
jgi:hypothetical protein